MCLSSVADCDSYFNRYSTHCTVKDHIITVDKDYQVCVWDRYSSEFLSRTRQIHAIGIAVLEDHIAVGGRQCVHIHWQLYSVGHNQLNYHGHVFILPYLYYIFPLCTSYLWFLSKSILRWQGVCYIGKWKGGINLVGIAHSFF